MFTKKVGPRAEHQQLQRERIQQAATMATEFGALSSLQAELIYIDPLTARKSSPMKYSVNIAHAKSVFRFRCPNGECVRGDFDLTQALCEAVAARKKAVKGQLVCQGWRNTAKINVLRCGQVLQYKLVLKY